MNWYDILGTLGVAVIVLTYVMLQIERVRSDQLIYSLLNAIGASLILISLYFDFNLPHVGGRPQRFHEHSGPLPGLSV